MMRLVVIILTWICATIFVLLGCAWLVNIWRVAGFRLGSGAHYTEFCFNNGCSCLSRVTYEKPPVGNRFRERIWSKRNDLWGNLAILFAPSPVELDFVVPRQLMAPTQTDSLVIMIVPNWIVMVPTAILPTGSLINRLRRRRRHLHGQCPNCGYDLRATPGRCPECGKEISATDGAQMNTDIKSQI